jgi:PhnB protein
MHIQPYLFFEGRCEEAAEFYRKALGAEITQLVRFKEGPEPSKAPGDKIMHMSLRIGATELLVSDGFCKGQPEFRGLSLCLTAATDTEARRWFEALAEGGQVSQPMAKTFFSSSFGMLTDRFGLGWMVFVKA